MAEHDDIRDDLNPKHADLSKVQVEICDTELGELPPTDPEYCPSCIIDENAPTRNWWTEQHPYLNGQTCEYYIPVSINAEGKSYTARELRTVRDPFNVFKYSYLRPGIRKALKFFNKVMGDELVCAKMPEVNAETSMAGGRFSAPKKQLYKDRALWNHLGKFSTERSLTDKNGHEFKIQEINDSLVSRFEEITNPDALELYASVKDYHLGNGHEPIQMLVCIPAYVFDQVPASVASVIGRKKKEPNPDDPEDPYNLRTEVELDGKTFKKNMNLMYRTFEAWQKYQALFYSLQGGRIKQATLKDPDKYTNFYIKFHSKNFLYFKEALDELLEFNGFRLMNRGHKLAADKIKITFTKPTKNEPYKVEKVEAKCPNCEYEPCEINFEKFSNVPAVKSPTMLNYVAQLDESIVLIKELEETPWVDWMDQYTYPKLKISYGDVQESNIPCVDIDKNPDEIDDAMFTFDFDMGDMLEWLLAQFNCKTLTDMGNYDPFKEIGDLSNKFKKLIEGFTFTDNDPIKDLFGLPIDMKALRNRKPMDIIEDFFRKITICNMAALLLEILKCLFSGFSLDELIGILIKKILYSASVFIFEPIYKAFEPVYGETVSTRAPMRLGGFTTEPWDYFREINDEAQTPGDYVAWFLGAGETSSSKAPPTVAAELSQQSGGVGIGGIAGDITNSFDGGLPGLTQSGWLYQNKQDLYNAEMAGTAGAPSDVEELKPPFRKVFEVWLDEFMDALGNFDELLKFVENIKGGALLKMALALFGCPYKNFLKDLFAELKDMINLGSLVKECSLGQPIFKIPKLPLPLPPFNFMEMILRPLLNLLIKKLIDLIAMLLLMILLKLLMALSCASLKALGDFIKNGFQLGDDSLNDAIEESFCGEDEADADGDADGAGGPGEGAGDLNALLGALDDQGIVGNPEDVAALAADLGAAIPKNAFKDAFLQPPELQDPDLMAQIADIVTARHPSFAAELGDPNNVGKFLSGIGNLLNDDQRAAVAASLLDQDEIDGPINPSICLTSQEKLDWDAGRRDYINDLCGDLPMDGFRPGEEPEPLEDDLWPYPEDLSKPTLGEDWLDKLNNRERDNLDEMLDLFLNGPAAVLGDALDDALKQGMVNCKYDPITGEPIEPDDDDFAASKSIIPPMPVEIQNMMDDAKKSVFLNVETRFYNDLQGKYHSFFNHLLSDTYNAPYYRGSRRRPSHNTLVRHPFMAPNAADTEKQWQEKWDVVKDRFVFPRFFMQVFAPRNEDFETDLDSPFPTNVYPETIGLWMREQLIEAAENLEFKTDMGLRRQYRTANVSRKYTRRRWGMYEKVVTYQSERYAQPKPELILKFRDNNNAQGSGWNYGFNLRLINYICDERGKQLKTDGYRVVLDELESTNIPRRRSFASRYGPAIQLPATTRVSRDTLFDVNVMTDPGASGQILGFYKNQISESELEKYNLSGIVFKNYIKNVFSAHGITANISDNLLAKDLFEELNNFVYSNVINFAMDNPDGESFTLPGYKTLDADGEEVVVSPQSYSGVPEAFLFGYVDDNLTKADLTYVSPEANPNNEDTWEYDYDNEEKVLGKSATEHPRVEFLDPEIHDMGKFTRPKIYIKPPAYRGWLAINQMIVPEDDNHEPKRSGFLFIDDMIKKEKDLRDEIPMDERLMDPRKCAQEGPYDVFSDPSGHAGTHVAVLSMARVYAFEHLLKSMSLYQIIKPDYKNNFDESVLAGIVADMEEDLKDLPRRRSKRGFFRGYSFWLLYLEQSAQAVERMIISGDLEPTSEISTALEEINKIRKDTPMLTKKWIKILKHVRKITWTTDGEIEEIDFAYSRKIKGKRKYYPMQIDLEAEDMATLKMFLDAVFFYSLGRNFRSILASETRHFAYRMRRRQKRLFKMALKIYVLHQTRNTAKSLLKYIVADQLNYYGDKIVELANDKERAGPKPKYYIDNVRKYFFGSSGTILSPFSGGLAEEEYAFQEQVKEAQEAGEDPPTFSYNAPVQHVIHDQTLSNPTDSFSSAQRTKLEDSPAGNFYFEKYIRVIDKPSGHSSETQWYVKNQKSTLSSRSDLLKGVVNIKEFQNFMKQNISTLSQLSEDTRVNADGETEPYFWDTKVSNIFGDATPVFEEQEPAEEGEEAPPPKLIGYDGSVGIKFGVRLCYIPPKSFDPDVNTSQARKQKSFLFKESAHPFPDHSTDKIFPIVSFERDIIDVKVKDLNLDDDNFGEELDCYVEGLMNSPEFSLIFDYCAPIRRASSMLTLYSHYAFIPSVAESPFERDTENGANPTEYWKSVILSQTKNSIRHLFIANYSSAMFLSEKAGSQRDGFKINFPELWKKLFQILINPFSFFGNLAVGWGGWRMGKRIVDRPYDMYGDPEGADDGVE